VEVQAGATLRFNRTDRAVVVNNVISGDGMVEVFGTVTLVNNNTFRGEIVVGPGGGGVGGKIVLGGVDPFGRSVVSLSGGVVEVSRGVLDLKVNNPIKLSGENTLTMGGETKLTLGGQLSGSGGVVKTGGGKLVLTNGTNSYSGGTVVRSGSLEITNATSLGKGELVLEGGGRFEVNQTLSLDVAVVVRSGEVYVGGTAEKKEVLTMEKAVSQGVSDVFVKSGVGTLELKSKESALRGVTLIQEGTLVTKQAEVLRSSREIVVGTSGSGRETKLDVSKMSGGLVVPVTQAVKGRGVISGRVVLGGSIKPGNSVDVLTVDGRELEDFGTNREVLRVQAGARLETEFSLYGLDGELAGVEAVDKLVVIGGVRFEGGKAGVVEVKPYIGQGVDRSKGIGLLDMRERTLNIIESTDAFKSGEGFAGVVSSMPLLDVRLETVNGLDGGRVALTMQMKDRKSAALALGIRGGNRSLVLKGMYAAAERVNGGVGGPGAKAVSEGRIAAVSAALEPLLMAGSAQAALAVLDQLGSTSAYADLVGVSTKRMMNLGYVMDGRMSVLMQGGVGVREGEEGKWSVWSNGYGLTNWMRGDGQGYEGYRSQGWGDMMGMERREGGLVLGLVSAGGMTRTYFGGGVGRASTSSWHFGVYGSATAESGLMVSWAGMWGIADNTMRRMVSVGGVGQSLQTRFDSQEWLAQVGVGMDVVGGMGGWSVIPSLRVVGSGYMAPQVQESGGALASTVGAMSESTVMTKAGIEVSKSGKVKEIPLRFSATVDYVRDFSADPRRATSRLNGATDVVWDSMSARRKENGVKVGAAVEARLSASKSVRVYGEQEMGARDNVARYGVSFSIEF